MEDDDDFGDLYTDVLQSFPFASKPSSSAPQQPSDPTQSPRRGIDLNLELDEEEEEECRDGAAGKSNRGEGQPLASHVAAGIAGLELNLSGAGENSGRESGSRGVEENASDIPGLGRAGGGGGGSFDEESFRFDLEEEAEDGHGDTGSEHGEFFDGLGREDAGGDDWDSDDSEDDLQIVLNDTSHGPMAMEMGGALGGEMDDGQNEGLGIGAEGDGVGYQHHGMEETEWGEDGVQAADSEKREGVEVSKLSQGIAITAKPGYGGHGYHPFHSQFKYIRPGAAPLQGAPAAGPGAPGHARPLVNIGPMAGRGRGDWRPLGVKNVPGMLKEYGGPGWGNNAGGRGRGIGLDFTLPSHKTIFEVDIDSFEEKPWNNPGVDVTDFFNFGLTEESWKGYIKKLEQLRVASTMQSRIRVYESGRSEQAYDPDMPPELAAAAAGLNGKTAENVNFRKVDADQIDVGKNLTPARPPIPTGRPIQVETGSGERPPSIDTRPPRYRDSDAIIEIVCEAFAEGQSSEDGTPMPSEHDEPSKTKDTENHVNEELPVECKKAEINSSEERRLASPVKASHHSEPSGSGGENPEHSSGSEDRHSRVLEDKSPHSISRNSDSLDDQRDGSTECIDGKRNVSASPDKVMNDHESNDVQVAKDDDDLPLAMDSAAMEDEIQHEKAPPAQIHDSVLPRSEKQKVSSRGDLSSSQDDGEDLKATRINDDSKPRPGNGNEHLRSHDVGGIVAQGLRGANVRNSKRQVDDDERKVQKSNRVEKQDMKRYRDVVKGREDTSVHRDGGLAKPSYVKFESSDKIIEKDSSEGVRQRRDEDLHGRRVRAIDYGRQGPKLLERGDEMSSKYSGKGWDGDRIEKEGSSFSRKQIDNGNWRGHHEKDVGLRQRERDESSRARHENIDENRMRKNEENLRRDYSEKEELLISRRESPSLRKREREDLLDQRRRDDQTRTRDNSKDCHSLRQKNEVRIEREKSERPNERDDRQRTKQYHEASMTRREREEIREPLRIGRSTDEKWASHAREKVEFNDAGRYAESKRRDRADDMHLLLHRGHEDKYPQRNPSSKHYSKSRKDGQSSHIDYNASINHMTTDDKPKESTRNKEYDARRQDSPHVSKRAKDDRNSHRSEKAGIKRSSGEGNTVPQTQANPNLIRKRGEEPVTDDNEQQQTKKGRSKMERWTSHKERDFAAIAKSASSLKVKDTIRSSINTGPLVPAEPDEEDKPAKSAEAIDPKPSLEEKPSEGVEKKDNMKEVENKKNNPLQTADQHLDTVAKLKKRSERFKLPMPSEKDTTNKKPETDPLLPSQAETPPADPEVKSERPPRKRRWISS